MPEKVMVTSININADKASKTEAVDKRHRMQFFAMGGSISHFILIFAMKQGIYSILVMRHGVVYQLIRVKSMRQGGIFSDLSKFPVGHDGFPFYCLRKSEEGAESRTILPALLA